VKRITWTFDPLQSRNAHFNFSKLGVIADRYYVDYYGVTSSFLHRYGTDRLWVTWLLEDESVKPGPADIEALPHLVRVGENLEPIVNTDPITSPRVVLEIPRELTEHHKLWRMATRDAFTRALDQGFIVQGFYNGRYYLAADDTD
jgi:predicted GNAT superfamily acetyltransferase